VQILKLQAGDTRVLRLVKMKTGREELEKDLATLR